jgi:hypothetical protein
MAGPTAKLSAWSGWSSGDVDDDQKQVALALSDRPVWPSALRHSNSDVVA